MQDQATKTPASNPPKCLERGKASEPVERTCGDSQLEGLMVPQPEGLDVSLAFLVQGETCESFIWK